MSGFVKVVITRNGAVIEQLLKIMEFTPCKSTAMVLIVRRRITNIWISNSIRSSFEKYFENTGKKLKQISD
jgi:hypothetical protein